jgi:hypothetical protein
VRREERDAGFVFTSGFEINQGIYTKATKRTKFRMSVEQEVAEGRESKSEGGETVTNGRP